jgi:hypothetical protein
MNLLDPRFKYVPAVETDIASTWRRFGFDPLANEKRRARLKRLLSPEAQPAVLSLVRSGPRLKSEHEQ